jgi:hypothetical protein
VTRKASTVSSPPTLATQNSSGGRSPARSTANTAVMAGSTVMTIAPCAEVWLVSASEVNSGKPTTTPRATIDSRRH